MIAICIPVYRTQLHWYEKVSLKQAMKVFGGKYDICFCVPNSIGDFYIEKFGKDVIVHQFADKYFTSIRAYSELCLSSFFYNEFNKYEYMLLYQLDAFVFSDQLESFCDMGYDYFGVDACDGRDWNIINEAIGCGGLSLRKVSSFIRILTENYDLLKKHPLRGTFYEKEDVFWGYCGHNPQMCFKIPSINIANQFAITFGTDTLIKENDCLHLPFGTHAWHRYDYDVWKPIIEEYGFRLPDCCDVNFVKTTDTYAAAIKYRFVINELAKGENELNVMTSCSVWGAGYNGIRCIRLLNTMGVKINHVFDWNINALMAVDDIVSPCIELPTCENLEKVSPTEVVIITTKIDDEIKGKIKSMNYLLYTDFLEELFESRRAKK